MLDGDSFDEGISSPVAVHILDFCDDGSGGDLFAPVSAAVSEMFTASSDDASATSSSTTTTAPSVCSHGDNLSPPLAAAFSSMPSFDSTLSALLEEEEDPPPVAEGDVLFPMEYTFVAAAAELEKTHQKQQFAPILELPAIACPGHHQALQAQMSSATSELMQLPSEYNDQCLVPSLAGFMGLDETLCQQHGGGMLSGGGVGDPAAAQLCFFGNDAAAAQRGFFGGGGGDGCTGGLTMPMMGMEEIGEYQLMMEGGAGAGTGAGALFGTHGDAAAQMTLASAAADMQMGESLSPGRLPPPPPATDTSGLDDASFKAARLSVEERKEKIDRYIKKRNERNFSKKIKYACRKTLADSRPRVRGRFAKNDDYCESSTAIGSENHEEYESIAGVKGEDMLDSETLERLNAMNPYMYSHTVESWI